MPPLRLQPRALPRLLRQAAALALLPLGAAGADCAPEERAGLARDEFVEAYMALVRARIDADGDTAAYAAARARALERAGVSAAEMRAYVEDGRNRPEELGLAWQTIAARLDTLYGGVTGPPPDLGGAPLGAGLTGEPAAVPRPSSSPTALPDTSPGAP
ncbi:MAG: hypothetical protein ABR599_02565 [Gemmatimonadota bacterium]